MAASGYLLDTNVISELRRRKPHGAVLAWIATVPDAALHLAAVTLAEIQAGIEMTRRQDAEKAREIEAWLDQVEASYSVLPADGRVFREWGRLMARRPDTEIEDALIAATAIVHGLTVVTRNSRHFRLLGVPLVDPFTAG
jgi:hypothetical protein